MDLVEAHLSCCKEIKGQLSHQSARYKLRNVEVGVGKELEASSHTTRLESRASIIGRQVIHIEHITN
jgi:hypothetical protein